MVNSGARAGSPEARAADHMATLPLPHRVHDYAGAGLCTIDQTPAAGRMGNLRKQADLSQIQPYDLRQETPSRWGCFLIDFVR